MDERRAATRQRVIYGAVATTPTDGRSYDCVVKNWSDLGARIEFSEPARLPNDIALNITQKGVSYSARVVWADAQSAGVAFTSAPADAYSPVILNDGERADGDKTRLLQRRVSELGEV